MKISRPTNVTITAIAADSGSSTQPRSTVPVPICTQAKLTVSRTEKPCDHPLRTWPNATSASSSETASDPMASDAAALRAGCFISAISPEATMGTAGISQRICAIDDAVSCGVNAIPSCISGSPLHPVHLVEIRCVCMSINRNHEPQSYSGLGRSYSNGKNGKHHPRQQLGVRAVPPERNQVQVGRIQHQLDPDQHQDRVAPRQRSGQPDGEHQPGHQQISTQRRHLLSPFSCMATITAPSNAAVSSSATISSGST